MFDLSRAQLQLPRELRCFSGFHKSTRIQSRHKILGDRYGRSHAQSHSRIRRDAKESSFRVRRRRFRLPFPAGVDRVTGHGINCNDRVLIDNEGH